MQINHKIDTNKPWYNKNTVQLATEKGLQFRPPLPMFSSQPGAGCEAWRQTENNSTGWKQTVSECLQAASDVNHQCDPENVSVWEQAREQPCEGAVQSCRYLWLQAQGSE